MSEQSTNEDRLLILKNGFTLAEILITLLIVGVISSIVIPGIIADSQQTELKTAWKKTYSELESATRRIIIDNAGTIKNKFDNSDSLKNEYLQYLAYAKSCPASSTLGNCWFKNDSSARWLNNSGIHSWGGESGLILNNGSLLIFWISSQQCNSTSNNNSNYCGWIRVDVNGFKGPNTMGKDIFSVWLYENRIHPWGSQEDAYNNDCITNPPTGSGYGCSAKYLYQ